VTDLFWSFLWDPGGFLGATRGYLQVFLVEGFEVEGVRWRH